MDDMILNCNQNTIYVLNTSYSYSEFDMIGLFGTPAGRSLSNHSSISSTQTKVKPKPAANLLDPSNQSNISNSNASVHGQNHQNLFKKRPNFLRFFNGNFLKSSADDTASEHSCKSEKTSSSKKTRRTSKEMYKEAAEFLGIACTLTDDCRCLDCQANYFDCDDDSDTYSNLSNVNIDEDYGQQPSYDYYCDDEQNCNFQFDEHQMEKDSTN